MEASAANRVTVPSSNGSARHAEWLDHTRVVLQPIAAPSILGLFGFAGSTFVVAANLAGWYGTTTSGQYLFPFALAFGGIAQFAAGMWAYRARDAIATAMHGMWGSFWIAYGILQLLFATGTLTAPPDGNFSELGYWFVALAILTGFGTIAAAAKSLALTAVLGSLTAGAALTAAYHIAGGTGWGHAAGWVLIVSAALAAYTAGAMMIASAWGRSVLPLGERRTAGAETGGPSVDALEYELGEPGVKRGQ
jgi:succinate-acetate transporter protein